MKPVKFIALVICTLMLAMSIPHVTLWGLSIGSGIGFSYDITTTGIQVNGQCNDFYDTRGFIRCAHSSGSYRMVQCTRVAAENKWTILSQYSTFSSQDLCASECKNSQPLLCAEPRLVVWAERQDPNTQVMSDASSVPLQPSSYPNAVMIKSKEENPSGGVRSYYHYVKYQLVRSASKTSQTENCGNGRDCSYRIFKNTLQLNDRIEYWSEITFTESSGASTYIRAPASGFKYFTILNTPPTAPQISSFTASPPSVAPGQSSELSWTVSDATSLSIDHGVGSVTFFMSKSVSPAQTTTYTLTATNSVGTTTRQVTVTVTSTPSSCGNGRPDPGEDCDGTNLGGQTCQSKGFSGGTLRCNNCRFDTSQCTGPGAGGLTASSTPVNVNAGATATSQISGGTGAHTATSSDASKATAQIDQNSKLLTITGIAAGTATITVKDSSSPQKNVQIPITVNPAGTTTPPDSATVQINPSAPAANTQFTITFILSAPLASNSVLKYQISGQSFVNQLTRSNCVGNSCTSPVNGLPAGTYNVIASLVTGTAETSLSLNPSSFSVAAAPTAPGSPATANQCCVTKSGTTYTYDDTTAEVSCTGADKFFYPTSCANAQNTVCNNFCQQDQKVPSGGSCGTQPTDPNIPRYSICRSGVCVCNTGGSYDTRNVPCNQACFTSSSSYFYLTSAYSAQRTQAIPIGQCTSNPEAIVVSAAVFGQATTAGQYVQQPQILQPAGAYQCLPNENCVCTYIDFSSFSARNSRPTLPGTETAAGWKHPRDVTASAPKKNPNEHVCGTATNATITASLGPAGTTQASGTTSAVVSRLIQAGDTVTITGKVTKLSEACAGYKRTCIAMKPLACEVKNSVMWTTLDYRDCPADFPEDVHKEGGGRKWNWRLIAAIGIAAATWGIGAAAGGGVATVPGGIEPAITAVGIPTVTTGTSSGLTLTGVLQAAALAQLGGSAIDGLSCGTSREGVGESAAQQLYFVITELERKRQQGGCRLDSDCAAGFRCNTQNGECQQIQTGQQPPQPSGGQQSVPEPSQTDTNFARYTSCNNCVTNGGSWCFQSSKCYAGSFGTETCTRTLDGCRNPSTGDATSNPTFDITGYASGSSRSGQLAGAVATNVLNQLPACPSAEDIQGCFSVCGRTYETVAGPDPLCGEGGPVIGFSEAEYKCGLGTCGGYASKGVKIEIRGPDGSVAISDTATTDANGDFSYTFTAPAADGEFVAVLSVPKG